MLYKSIFGKLLYFENQTFIFFGNTNAISSFSFSLYHTITNKEDIGTKFHNICKH